MLSRLLSRLRRRRLCEACGLRPKTSTGFCSDACAKTFHLYDV